MKELKLIPPTDPRVQTAIAPFTDDMLKEHDFKDRKELTESMFECMKKFHGIGLTANQVGLPFNMFVAGGHPSIENGKAIAMYNPYDFISRCGRNNDERGLFNLSVFILIYQKT